MLETTDKYLVIGGLTVMQMKMATLALYLVIR
jgi:hypothetical protein